jgi:hypothetical protein
MGTHGSNWEVRSLITPIDPTRPFQQLLRKLGGSMYSLPPEFAPEARLDLGGARKTRVNRRASLAATGCSTEALAGAVGVVGESLQVSATGIVGISGGYLAES